MSAPTALRIHEHGVDVNRGATIRKGVCMHKDDPGVYFTKSGFEVTDKVAKLHGFRVEENRKARAKNMKLKQAIRDVEIEFGERKAEIQDEFADPAEGKKLDSELVTSYFKSGGHPRETEHYAMKHMGRTLWTVLDKRDGGKQRIEPTEREDAIDWMLTHAEEDARVEAKEQADD